jgi:outer membrane protein TolC
LAFTLGTLALLARGQNPAPLSPAPAVEQATGQQSSHGSPRSSKPADVKKTKLQVQQADYDARAKKAEYIPDVSLAFSYYTTANFENVFPTNVGTVGMSFR